MQKIAVICGGSWGTAIAQIAANAGRDVTLWARESGVVDAINAGSFQPPGMILGQQT